MIKHAFVTGATGLLGGQIVRTLVARNIEVSALVRSREKAAKMFGGTFVSDKKSKPKGKGKGKGGIGVMIAVGPVKKSPARRTRKKG